MGILGEWKMLSDLKLALGLLIMFLAPSIAISQDLGDLRNSTPEQRAKSQTEWMKTELSLDPEVASKVYDINLKYAERNQAIINSSGSRKQMRRELKASGDDKDKELKKVLAAEQYKTYQQKKDEMKQQVRQGRRGKRQYS